MLEWTVYTNDVWIGGYILSADANSVPIAGSLRMNWKTMNAPQKKRLDVLIVGVIYFYKAVNLVGTEALTSNHRQMVICGYKNRQ